jgi:hypothetical protein
MPSKNISSSCFYFKLTRWFSINYQIIIYQRKLVWKFVAWSHGKNAGFYEIPLKISTQTIISKFDMWKVRKKHKEDNRERKNI